MKKSISASHKWHRSEISNPISIIYIFILITLLKLVVSQLPMTDCSLDIKFLSNPDCSGCEGGDWGGFLHTNNCGVAFDAYLNALGRRANQTGQIFINFSEQRNCLNSMKIIQPDIFGCGIEKLTGGCSDFSVEDVTSKMGDELRRLNENCELVNSDGEFEQSCSYCARTRETIVEVIPHLSMPSLRMKQMSVGLQC